MPRGQMFHPRQHLGEQQVGRRRPSDGTETPGSPAVGVVWPLRAWGTSAQMPARREPQTRSPRPGPRSGPEWSVHPGPACPSPWGSVAAKRPVPALSLNTRHEFRQRGGQVSEMIPMETGAGLLSSVDLEDARLREVPRLSGRAAGAGPGPGCRSPNLEAPTGCLQSLSLQSWILTSAQRHSP